ncbi:DNA methylase [Cytophagales bacterium WSM2-2]|nr:DNA methylase [Cytophagales bacterium WSM2-2]
MPEQIIQSPKQKRNTQVKESWYPYYAGFSKEFVSSLIDSFKLSESACIADPWNGSGTTTSAAFEKGFTAYGYDLNPVMVIAAKASLLPSIEKSSLIPLSIEIVNKARQFKDYEGESNDPLNIWFLSSGSNGFRKIERSIQKILIDEKKYRLLNSAKSVEDISTLAAFYYVAIFRVLREILDPFKTSNPTWIKKPKSGVNKLRPNFDSVAAAFLAEVRTMVDLFPCRSDKGSRVHVGVGSSCLSPLQTSIIDLIITSPPYCTRIDYAVATMPELTLLGFDEDMLDSLRRQLIGTSTVPKASSAVEENWGPTCVSLLNSISRHESKASQSYYYKNHVQYFDSMYKSLNQISRILKPNGVSVLVVQDSYYKDIHNDLPKIITEMSEVNNLSLTKRKDFLTSQNMVGINPAVKKYNRSLKATESVLFLKK